MRYIVTDATSAGEATIRVYFEPGTDPNINVVHVQNRVNIVLNRLPPLVVRAELDDGTYPTGIKISERELAAVNLDRNDFHGEWNYTVSPSNAA